MPSGSAIANGPNAMPDRLVNVSAKKLMYLNTPSDARFATIAAVTIAPCFVATYHFAASQLIRIEATSSGRNRTSQ